MRGCGGGAFVACTSRGRIDTDVLCLPAAENPGFVPASAQPESPVISRRPSQDRIMQAKAAAAAAAGGAASAAASSAGPGGPIDPRFAAEVNAAAAADGAALGGQDGYEWHEDEPASLSSNRLDGMGSLQEQEQGMSYLGEPRHSFSDGRGNESDELITWLRGKRIGAGLSSGAAVLNAIRRLSKDMPKLGLEVWRPESGRPVDRPHSNGKPKVEANGRRKLPSLPLPSFAQTAVLVDSYFCHFRKSSARSRLCEAAIIAE